MKLLNFGELVKALRQNSLDEDGIYLSREKLSEIVHLSPHQLGRLERGSRKYLDNQTLGLLANAFKLTALERREFYIAALGISDDDNKSHLSTEAQLKELLRLLGKMQAPAFIMDVYADMIAANSRLLKLLMITPDLLAYAKTIPAGFNVLNFIYSSESGFKTMIGPRWKEYAVIELLLFRRSTLRFRHTEYFKHLLSILLKEKEFDIDWYASHIEKERYGLTYVHYEYLHPGYGPLSYLITETVVNTDNDNLYLIIYNAMDNRSADVFSRLSGSEESYVQKMASWPEKTIIK